MGSGCSSQAAKVVADAPPAPASATATTPGNPVATETAGRPEALPMGGGVEKVDHDELQSTAATKKPGAANSGANAAKPKDVMSPITGETPNGFVSPPNALVGGKHKSAATPMSTGSPRKRKPNMYTREEIALKCGTMISLVQQMDPSCKFDNRMATNFSSSKWDDRQDALNTLSGPSGLQKWKLNNVQPPIVQEAFEHLTAIVIHCMEDNVRPVCLSALECFTKVLDVFSMQFKRSPCEEKAREQLTKAVNYLFVRMGDSNAKIKAAAKSCLMDVVHMQYPRGMPIVWRAVLRQGEKKEEAMADGTTCARLMMLHTLISDCGFSKKDGLTLSSTMSLAVPALAIADQKTRNAAMDVVVAAYAAAGERVNKHLHGCKPAMVKILKRKFQELHDQELFGDPQKDSAQKKMKEAKQQMLEKKRRSNQQSPGASEEEESDNEETEESLTKIPASPTEDEAEQAMTNAVELLNNLDGLGVVLVHKLSSEKWSDRKEAFDQLTEWGTRRETELIAAVVNNGQKKEVLTKEFAALCVMLQPAIQQNVMPVVMSACGCLKRLIKSYSRVCDWKDSDSCKEMHFLIPALLEKTGGTNQRVQREACKCLLELCRANHGSGLQRMVPHLLKEEAARPSTSTPNPKAEQKSESSNRPATGGTNAAGKNLYKNVLRAKLIMIKLLVKEFGVRSRDGGFGCGLKLRELMGICKVALDEADSKTRKAGISVVVEVEKIVGKQRVMKHLEGVKESTMTKILSKIDPSAVQKTKAKRELPSLNSSSSNGMLEPLKPLPATMQVSDPFVLKGKPLMKKPPHNMMAQQQQQIQPPQQQQSIGHSHDDSVARSLDFSSDIMDDNEERFMSSILDNAPGYVF